MLLQPSDPISSFLKEYHLWSLVLFLCLLGFRDTIGFAIWSWYKLRCEIDEASYGYKAHHVENKRRYEQIVSDSATQEHRHA